MFPATSARHLSIVRPRIAKPPTRIRGLRGDSCVRSFPITFVFIIHANDEGRSRNPAVSVALFLFLRFRATVRDRRYRRMPNIIYRSVPVLLLGVSIAYAGSTTPKSSRLATNVEAA